MEIYFVYVIGGVHAHGEGALREIVAAGRDREEATQKLAEAVRRSARLQACVAARAEPGGYRN
jgi:hypothetical protein